MNDEMCDLLMSGRVKAVEQVVQEATRRDLLEPVLKGLPSHVAETLRVIAAGERPVASSLPTSDAITRFGKALARWGVPTGRWTLGSFMGMAMAQMMAQMTPGGTPATPKPPPPLLEALTDQLGLSADQAARIEAVARWKIGFLREDLAQWGPLSPEEAEAVWELIQREYGTYMTGTLYAVP